MMSVVHRLTTGWLLDHLSFINQCGYEICDSFACPGDVTVKTSVSSANDHSETTSATTSSSYGPGGAVEAKGKTARTRYVFREEFFHISKAHIAAAPGEQLLQGSPKLSVTEMKASSSAEEHQEGAKCGVGDSVVGAKKKRKRKCVFNQGELDALEYHTKVRKFIWEGTLHLVQEGLKSGFLHHAAATPSCGKNVVTAHIDCGLAELCEMAKQFPAVNDGNHQAVNVLGDETSIPEQDLLSCVTENNSNCAKIVVLMGQKYLVPPKSSFLLSDISCLQPLLNYKKKYDVIVIDPPWENKSVKRSNRKSEDVLPVPEHKLIVSIPCSLHSHKPPLTAVLAEFIKPGVECLELFARNLQPGWTSWGNEVLKFQHIDYFTLLRNES
ncbi:N(6)-adenine-specific methyltransferase METTL4 isoform X2 [Cyrtonyx montezumae]|uniref:N(6)-adenine-specific methyltransferase METTL4 isoform X2 n=1 Tax=Cyrtonyx montezumae TaxID=9017 RepID=UPI0032DAAEB1